MKWVLLVFVFGASMVKTDLVFDTLDECLRAEELMRSEYTQAYNKWLKWAEANPKDAMYPESQKFIFKRNGLETTGTCIPTKSN